MVRITERQIVIAAACYKRPDVAAKMLDSFADCGMPFCGAYIALQPETYKAHNTRFSGYWTTKWGTHRQMPVSVARVVAVNEALREFQEAEIIFLTDDDVEAIPGKTALTIGMVKLLENRDTGLMAISRLIRRKQWDSSPFDIIAEPLPYIGGGWFITRQAWEDVAPQPVLEAGDEKAIALAFYLKGYTNYRSRQSFAYHHQNGAHCRHGGLSAVIEEYHSGANVVVPHNTQFDQEHKFLQTEPMPAKYGGLVAPYLTTGANATLTKAANRMHDENRKRLR